MTAKQAELVTRYGVILPYPTDETYPPGELFPKQLAWVARQSGGARHLDVMAWGFPHTVPGKSGKPIVKAVTNVRNYTSPFWRSALANPERRCLVPVTAFSEYGPGEKGHLPLYWFDVPSRPILSFAGVGRPAEGGTVFAFLTTEPNEVVRPIHPKAMPVILHDEDEGRWLTAPIEEVLTLAAPYPSQLMTAAL
jgi:putative SOS response-associated peptidase YedK